MKKILVMTLIGVFTFTGFAYAAFEHKTQEQVTKEIVNFYNETKGDKLSTYSIEGLFLRINKIFMENIMIPKPVKQEKEDGTSE